MHMPALGSDEPLDDAKAAIVLDSNLDSLEVGQAALALALALGVLPEAPGATRHVLGDLGARLLVARVDVEGDRVACLRHAALAVPDVHEDVLALIRDETEALRADKRLHSALAAAAANDALHRPGASRDVLGHLGPRLLVTRRDVKGDEVTRLRHATLAIRDVYEDVGVLVRDEAEGRRRVEGLDGALERHGCDQCCGICHRC
mmetsp:Transcript_48838/g.66481  ORF Transcript_48838/g.66481 Transcript_48838/m.66481 type:complete len:204 (+) Transcript_48838:604-1215(+)